MSIDKPLLEDHPDIPYAEQPSESCWRGWRGRLYDAWCYATFSHADVLLDKGQSKTLELDSAAEIHPGDAKPSNLLRRFEAVYPPLEEHRREDGSRGVGRVIPWRVLGLLVRLEWRSIAASYLLLSIELVSKWSTPFLLRQFLLWFQQYDRNQAAVSEGWMWASLMILGAATNTVGHHRSFWRIQYTGYRMRTMMMAAVYAKLLRINTSTMSQVTTGHVVNLISNDMTRFDVAVSFPYLLIGPLELGFALFIVSKYLGVVPAFAGMSILILCVPVQAILSHFISKYRDKIAKITDRRINTTSEIVTGMLAVKMLGWEDILSDRVEKIREKEHRLLKIRSWIRAANSSLPEMTVHVVPAVLFITCRLMRSAFELPDVFFALSLIIIVSTSFSYWFVESVRVVSELFVTSKRMDAFFQSSERPSIGALRSSAVKGTVEIKKGNYGWFDVNQGLSKERIHPTTDATSSGHEMTGDIFIRRTLKDIDIFVRPGELVGIAGAVGSGKSCLFYALLNEMEDLSPHKSIAVSGTVAFCSQAPWIKAGTVRDNIVFGKTFDPVLYETVVDSCALPIDFQQLPNGDDTELGERGINISGGQKARVALARAAYARADIQLLDDPLSAVDARVGRILFDRCIGPTGLMKDSTRLLITHQLQFLPLCDRVFLMKNGRIEATGRWSELQQHDIVKSIMHEHQQISLDASKRRRNSIDRTTDASDKAPNDVEDDRSIEGKEDDKAGRLVVEEGKEVGKVAWIVYWKFFKHLGLFWVSFGISVLFISNFLFFFSQWWIAKWTGADEKDQKDLYWIWVLVASTATSACLSFFGITTLFLMMVHASTKLHRQMLRSVIRAPLKFFHTNPTGRILNRFSKDLGLQDEDLQNYVDDFVWSSLETVGMFVLIALAMPYMLIVFIPLAWIFESKRRRYVSASREIKRWDGITRSAVYAQLSDSIKGLSTIRAYGREDDFRSAFMNRVDVNGTWRTAYLITARWIGFRLDIMNVSVLMMTAFLSIFLIKQISPEVLGLALTYAVSLSGTVQVMVRTSAELENSMTSVERILNYTCLEQEARRASEGGGHAPHGWPIKGDIVYDSLTASYRPGLDPVLEDVNFGIPGGRSVGIVGRTGSGKTSLLLTLFRLIDIDQGSIVIDGINTADIGIDILRRQLAVIPQDPVLFGGSLRSNLDPRNEHSEAKIWDALNKVCLTSVVESIGGLDASIAEAGNNFSVGQRQILCLARAFLSDAKILALDEATANVDRGTDSAIQQSLRSLIDRSEKTLLIIAHRIDTVMDCDVLLVLDNGRLIETGRPEELLRKKDGLFAGMVQAARKATKDYL